MFFTLTMNNLKRKWTIPFMISSNNKIPRTKIDYADKSFV